MVVSAGDRVNLPPTASITTTPNFGPAPLTVAFNATANDPDGSIVSYAWDFGDGQSDLGVNVSHTFTTETTTTYTVTLTVTDDDGANNTCAQDVTVVSAPLGNQPPTPSFIAEPDIGELPLTVDFDVENSSDFDGSIDFYEWDFGDGTTAGGVNPTHTYNTAGTYTVTLTVTDDDREIGTCTDIIVCSTYIGIHSIWTIPIMWEKKLEKETGIEGLRLLHEFLLVGKDGTVLFPHNSGVNQAR